MDVPIAESIGLNGGHKVNWKNELEENLSKKELESLKNLSKNPDIVIQKSDKGNSVVILDKKVYLEKMKEMLNKNDRSVSKTYHTGRKTVQFCD